MKLDLTKQKYFYKLTFIIYALIFATGISLKSEFTIVKMGLMAWGVSLLIWDIYKEKGKMLQRNNILLILFLLVNLIAIAMFGNKGSNIKIFTITLIQFLVLNSFNRMDSLDEKQKEIKKLNFNFVCGSLIISLISIAMFFGQFNIIGIPYAEEFRPNLLKGLYLVSNLGGLVAFISIVISLISIKSFNGNKYLYCGNIIVQGVVLYFTSARAALLSFIVFIISYGFTYIKDKRIRVSVIIIIVGIIIAMPACKPYIEAKLNAGAKQNNYGFLGGREVLWRTGYRAVFKESPAVGVGYTDVVTKMKAYTDEFLPGLEGGRMHNIYLEITYSNGVLALIPFIAFMMIMIYKTYSLMCNCKIPKEDLQFIKLGFAMVMSFIALGFVESAMLYTITVASTIFWIYMGYINFYTRKYNRYK